MKFCYADESGGKEITVVLGVVVDAIRMHRTKTDWEELLADLAKISKGRVAELKGGQLYRGNDYWRDWDAGERTALIEEILRWMSDRKHSVTFGAVSRARLADAQNGYDLGGLEKASAWCVAAVHLLLSVQKQHQRAKQNKGKTVFVFDEAPARDEFLGFVLEPPSATSAFYQRAAKQSPLDQVVDVPYFADSRHVGLIQVADLFAYLLCLYAQLREGFQDEQFDGELGRLEEWMTLLRPVLLPDSARWPKSSKDPCTVFFRSAAPQSLLDLAS